MSRGFPPLHAVVFVESAKNESAFVASETLISIVWTLGLERLPLLM